MNRGTVIDVGPEKVVIPYASVVYLRYHPGIPRARLRVGPTLFQVTGSPATTVYKEYVAFVHTSGRQVHTDGSLV